VKRERTKLSQAVATRRAFFAVLAACSLLVAVATAAEWNARSVDVDGAVVASSDDATVGDDASADVAVAVEAEVPALPQADEVIEGHIRKGETLGSSLVRHAVGPATVHLIATEMAPVFNFRYARSGDYYRLGRSADGRLLHFDYERSKLERYRLTWDGEHYAATAHEPEILRRRTRIAGLIDSSLYESIEKLGGEASLANDFADVFAWDVDFSRSVRAGDEFAILYERLYLAPEDEAEFYVGPGRILAARYATRSADHRAVYFEPEEGRGGYYRPNGTAVERQFLRAPLHYRRISSAYSLSRLHPILKVRRPHQGIDYAAAHGTPVWSVGDGQVIFRGRMGGFGNLVKVRHNNGYVSYYGHLSGYAKGVTKGARVAQKQVLGFVGATGLATGPHLDYRLKKNGHYINPASLKLPAGIPIPEESLPRFSGLRDELLSELDPRPLVSGTGAL
jgi:murein DD-endopeptidase MepM/ murein hydrolase activator NlpD